MELSLIGAGVATTAGGAYGSGIGNEIIGLDKIQTVVDTVSSSSISWAAGLAMAGGVLIVGSKTLKAGGYLRNMPKVISSTFGTGNQEWAA
tara:strand:+ start:1280 stop:1552 length:273 start_codon:yes stop_codon:yes gene_type:complete